MRDFQCTATNKAGKRCGGAAIKGGNVCRIHGGSAPQVRAAANARLQALVHPSIDRIAKIIKDGEDIVAERAARGILDRTGYKEPDKIQLSGHDGGPLPDLTLLPADLLLTLKTAAEEIRKLSAMQTTATPEQDELE